MYSGQKIMARSAPLSDVVAGHHRTLLVLSVVSSLGTLAAAFGHATHGTTPPLHSHRTSEINHFDSGLTLEFYSRFWFHGPTS